jgi:hypothetical protein
MQLRGPAAGPRETLRSLPPGHAASGARRDLFSAALEQSAQLFEAAASTSAHARSILLFYGLSQAGRAIFAAHSQTLPRPGHGLRASPLNGPLLNVVVRDQGSGAFQAIADTVGSPSLPRGLSLGALYSTLPTTVDVLLDQQDAHLPALTLQPEALSGDAYLVITRVTNGWLHGLPQHLIVGDDDVNRARVSEFLASYPTLEAWAFPTVPPNPMQVRRDQDGRWAVRLSWVLENSSGSERERQERVQRAGVVVPGAPVIWVPPESAAGAGPMAPIVAWWATLFALLARYEPGSWVGALQPDQSEMAVPLESLLDAALEQVPALVLATLQDPTHWRAAAPGSGIGDADSDA